jgi:hypothetical protein
VSSTSLFAEILKDKKNREKAMKKLSVLKDFKEEIEKTAGDGKAGGAGGDDVDSIPVPIDNGPAPLPPPAPPVPDQVDNLTDIFNTCILLLNIVILTLTCNFSR